MPVRESQQISHQDLGCKVCQKIVRLILQTPFEDETSVSLGPVSDLLAGTCPHINFIRSVKYERGSVPRYGSRELWMIKEPEGKGWHLGVQYTSLEARGTVSGWSLTRKVELVARTDLSEGDLTGRARILDPQWIDVNLIQAWQSCCVSDHGAKCDKPIVQALDRFCPQWLIDVAQGCVVSSQGRENERFVTLSYTWGQTDNFRTNKNNIAQVQRTGALFSGEIALKTPQTIRNAIALTKILGLGLLWVDSLCIIQDDQESLTNDLRQMHRIYASSFLTIIAEDGHDADHGLRGLKGISLPRTTGQVVFPLAGGERLAMESSSPLIRASARIPKRLENPRHYSQRMWTFQEMVFAKRRLVFGSDMVKWQCNCVEWHEHLVAQTQDNGAVRTQELSRVLSALKVSLPDLSHLSEIITQFNDRSLTYDEDVGNAFLGTQTLLELIGHGDFLFGHPEFWFDISLCWSSWSSPFDDNSNLRRRIPSRSFKGDAFHDNLPSWSWMGWQGKTHFPMDSEFQDRIHNYTPCGFTQPVTKWYTMETPAEPIRRPINSQWYQFKALATQQQILAGWQLVAFDPPVKHLYHSAPEPREDLLIPRSMPKQLPQYKFTRLSQESEADPAIWYAIPGKIPQHVTIGNAEQQRQCLWCKTSRSFVYVNGMSLDESHSRFHPVTDESGKLVGGLELYFLGSSQFLSSKVKIELIAIVKGWTTEEPSFHIIPNVGYELRDITEEEEATIKESLPQRKDYEVPWSQAWDEAAREKKDCYFVLWIERVKEVAYRKAMGFIWAADWERLREMEDIEVVLN